MGQTCDTVTLYTAQRDAVVDLLGQQETYYVQKRFIQSKYGEVAHVFLTVYDWYTRHAAQLVPRPEEAESAVWAFADPADATVYEGSRLLVLEVPKEEAVFFDMLEWTDLLNFRYLGTGTERTGWQETLRNQGVVDEMQIITTAFYPMLKRELMASWSRLFRHHDAIRSGEKHPVSHIQAGLWRIKRDWIAEVR